MLTTNLQSQVTLVERSLAYLSGALQINRAQLAKIQENQIELGEELQLTQQALNATIPILNAHSNTINTLKSGTERLYTHFQHSFLYSAITRIFRNELTLEFLSPEDLNIIGALPMVQIVTNLLVRQQLDFVSNSQYTPTNTHEIGRLIITSYFAVPQQKHSFF
ncbi:unnamed protein product, partial [Adineta ricciae]